MSDRKLVILAVVAVIMVAWAVVQSRISTGRRAQVSGPAYLIQGLDPAAIDSIIVGAGKESVTLKREGANFVVVSRDNYPAEAKQINDLITKCLDIKTSELYTDDPKNHEDLEVTEQKARTVIKFLKPDASLLAGVIIGKTGESGQSGYVRLASSDKVYLASNVPSFRTRALDYIEQELTAVKREDIQSVQVTSPAGKYVLKADPNADSATLDNLPAGKKLKAGDAKSVLTALTSLTVNDVRKQSDETAKWSFDRQYICALKDSTVYTLKVAKKDDKWYASCQAEFTDKTPVTINRNEVEPEEQLKKKEAKLLSQEKAQKFVLKHAGWVYEIADWKAKYLTKELADLLEEEKKEPEKKEQTEPQTNQTTTEPNAAGAGQ